MTALTNRFVCLLLIVCASCASHSRQAAGANSPPVEAQPGMFLKASSETYVWVTEVTNENGHYMLIYSEDKKRGVALDLERDSKSGLDEVRNVGFGTYEENDDWVVMHDPIDGVRYESHGGLGTLQNFSDLLGQGLKQKQQHVPFKQVNNFKWHL